MVPVAVRRPALRLRARALVTEGRLETIALIALIAISAYARTREIKVWFWIDEALSVGISSHPLTDIPHVLRLDGSPPLYYLVLHGWMAIFGKGESATHALSLVFALLAIPASWWVGRLLFDRRAGWALAVLFAVNPFLTQYAQETRMYSLAVLLGLLTTALFVRAFVQGHRRERFAFGVGLALMLYTHNWTLFYALAAGCALLVVAREATEPRRVLRDGIEAFGLALLLYVPWIPTFLFQAAHTGAPWAQTPSWSALIHAPDRALGGQGGTIALLLAGGVGAAAMVRMRGRQRAAIAALIVLAVLPVLSAWLYSQVSSAWATRYLAIAVAPLLVFGGVALSRAGNLGLVALGLLALISLGNGSPSTKTNVHYVATSVLPIMRPDAVVISTQPEQIPVLYRYLPQTVHWYDPRGPVRDPRVADWRDGPERMRAATATRQLEPIIARLRPGEQILLVRPFISRPKSWRAAWTKEVAGRSIEWQGALLGDPRLELLMKVPSGFRTGPNPVQGLLFRRLRGGAFPDGRT